MKWNRPVTRRYALLFVVLVTVTSASAVPGRWSRLSFPAPSVWTVVVASPPSEDVFVAANAQVGGPSIDVYVSHDRGLSWSALTRPAVGFSEPPIIATTPANPKTIYVGAGGYSGETMARSDDGGQSWVLLGPNNNAQRLSSIAIDPSNANHIYAAFNGQGECDSSGCWNVNAGLFFSADRGDSWKELAPEFFESGATGVVIDPRPPGSVYGSSVFGVYASEDSGRGWRVLPKLYCYPPGLTPYSPGAYSLVLAVGARSEIYAQSRWVYEWGPACMQVQVSNETGGWSLLNLPSNPTLFEITVNPSNREELLATSLSGMFVSENSGVTWQSFGNDPGWSLGIYSVKFSNDGKTIYGVSDSSVYRYDREVSPIGPVVNPIPVAIGGR